MRCGAAAQARSHPVHITTASGHVLEQLRQQSHGPGTLFRTAGSANSALPDA